MNLQLQTTLSYEFVKTHFDLQIKTRYNQLDFTLKIRHKNKGVSHAQTSYFQGIYIRKICQILVRVFCPKKFTDAIFRHNLRIFLVHDKQE